METPILTPRDHFFTTPCTPTKLPSFTDLPPDRVPLLPESSSQIKPAVPLCREKKCVQSSVLAVHLCCSFPSPGEFGFLSGLMSAQKNPFTFSMILKVPTAQAIRSPYFLSRCFYFIYVFFFSFVLHEDRFVKKN